MKNELEQKKFYYPSGRLQAERSYKNGVPHGYHREWHENGILVSEVNYNNGVPEGVGKQWDENGNLIFSYSICNGTGTQKAWFGNQGIWAEVSWLNGKMTGRQRTYRIDDSSVIGDTYWINNRQVSKNKYIKMCEIDGVLPKYDDLAKGRTTKKLKDMDSFEEDIFCYPADDNFYEKLFSENKITEALSWLTEPNVPERTLGECSRPEDSIELVKDFYVVGYKY